MLTCQVPITLAVVVSLLLFTPIGVFAGDSSPQDLPAKLESGGQVSSKADPVRQQEIFQILQGGVLIQDATLMRHLWQVAGSLAVRDWNPPRVKIRVVVRDRNRR